MPDVRWKTISVNFIVELTKFIGFNIVMIIINSVFKRVHFVPIYTMVTIENAARLFLYYVWKLHDLPNHTVLNQEPQFITLSTS